MGSKEKKKKHNTQILERPLEKAEGQSECCPGPVRKAWAPVLPVQTEVAVARDQDLTPRGPADRAPEGNQGLALKGGVSPPPC